MINAVREAVKTVSTESTSDKWNLHESLKREELSPSNRIDESSISESSCFEKVRRGKDALKHRSGINYTKSDDNEKTEMPMPNQSQSQKKWDDFTVVWLDTDETESTADAQEEQNNFFRTWYCVRKFTVVEECLSFLMAETALEKILLIINHEQPQHVLRRTHHLSQIHSICIIGSLGTNTMMRHEWMRRYPKIQGMFEDIKSIYHQLNSKEPVIHSNTMSEISISILPATNISSEKNNNLDAKFMYAEMLKDIFVEMCYPDDVHKEFVVSRRKMSPDGAVALSDLAEFEETYCSDTAIEWYTRPCFVYSSLNEALRNNDVDTIYKMRFLVKHIHEHLQELQLSLDIFTGKERIQLYRGLTLPDAEFRGIKENIGGLLSFNTFLSTSFERKVAERFAGWEESTETSVDQSIIFRMDIDTTMNKVPYAPIDDISYFKNEKEVLFSMGTVFRIGRVQKQGDRKYLVDLTLTNDEDPLLKRLSKHIRQLTDAPHPLARLGKLLYEMGQYDQSLRIYRILLVDPATEENWSLLALCYADMGTNYHRKKEYNDAREMYERALEINKKYLNIEDHRFASLYNNLGGLQYDQGDYTSALESTTRAFEIVKRRNELDPRTVASYMKNIAHILTNLGRHEEAQAKFERVVEIEQKCLDPNDSSLAATFFNIGSTCFKQSRLQEAYEKYTLALAIRTRSLVPSHPEIAMNYQAIAQVLSSLGRCEEAMTNAKEAVSIFHQSFEPNHPSVESAEALVRTLATQQLIDGLFKKSS